MKSKKNESLKAYLLLTPVLILIAGVFLTGIFMGLLQSLGYFPVIGLNELTLDYYIETFKSPTFIDSLKFSLTTSFFQAGISVILGLVFAYNLVASKGWVSKIGHKIYKLPIMIPHTVIVLMIILQFGESGFISRLFLMLGLTDEMTDFPILIFDKNGIGIILAYVLKGLPFSVLIAYESLKNSYRQYAIIGRSLGASPMQVIRHIILPLVFPSLVSGFIILFVFSLGAYEVPYLLGSSTPRALPVEAYRLYNHIDLGMRPFSMVINMVITFMAIVLLSMYYITHKIVVRIVRGGESHE